MYSNSAKESRSFVLHPKDYDLLIRIMLLVKFDKSPQKLKITRKVKLDIIMDLSSIIIKSIFIILVMCLSIT